MTSTIVFRRLTILLATVWLQQDMGVITGIITDSTNAVIPDTRVIVTNRDTLERRLSTTSESGAYTIGPLRVGHYDIVVEREGFGTTSREDIAVHAQDRVRVDFRLEVGNVTETLRVTGDAPLLQRETSSLTQVVEAQRVQGLPLNGRNFQQLAWLSPGVKPALRSRDRESGFTAHGQPVTQNNFVIDGIDNNSNIIGFQDRKMQVLIPSLDAVAEFTVKTSNYSAEFGRNSGVVMIVSTKSGTKQFHGSLFEYLRNDAFDARDTFNYIDRNGDGKADPEALRQNQFGATFGGPMHRDTTFFFVSFESRRERRGQSELAIVPTLEERRGRFNPAVASIRDPLTQQPFPNGEIPADRLDPTAKRLLTLWPEPNFAGSGTRRNFIRNPSWNLNRDQFDTRVDHGPVFIRVSANRSDSLRNSVFEQPARGAQDNERAIDDNDALSMVASYRRSVGAKMLNEFRYGFIRQKVDKRELTLEPLSELADRFGILGVPKNERLFGLPQFSFSGRFEYTGLGGTGSIPNFKVYEAHQLLESLTWDRGRHYVKFGADLRWSRSDVTGGGRAEGFGTGGSHGGFAFDGQFTGSSFADFLLGYPASASLTSMIFGNMRFQDYMFFIQDDWRATRRLTVNLGLRYELNSPWLEQRDRMNTLVIDPAADFNTIRNAGYCGRSWSCRGLVNTDTNNWAPRLGFAYQWSERDVIRAGAGVFYGGTGALGGPDRGTGNFPYQRRVTRQSSGGGPPFRLRDGFPDNFLGDAATLPNNVSWTAWQTNFPAPTIYQWNMAWQRQLISNFILTTAYVGSSSNYVLGMYNWNGSPPGPPATEQQRRRIPQWNNITLVSPFGHASYHGLDLEIEKRYARGLSLSSAYTWGHSIDNIPEQFGTLSSNLQGNLQDIRDFNQSRGNSNFDHRHRYVGSVVYELPLTKTGLLTNWQVSAILTAQTGHYFSVTVPNSRARLGATGLGEWRADRISSGRLEHRSADRWFDTDAFVLPLNTDGSFRFGNAGRAILSTDGLFNLDMGLSRSFTLEHVAVQFRAEVFNLTNTPTLSNPTTVLENPDFGKVRSTISLPRQMQFSFRLSF